MKSIKEQVLLAIYEEFDKWLNRDFSCSKGCASCCTQNVVITAVEGEVILRFIREQEQSEWFVAKLQKKGETQRPEFTTNSFAACCLNGEDVEPSSYSNNYPCPFLKQDCCMVYKVRPFSCRCFVSTKVCTPGSSAIVSESHLSASTAVMQIIEHLGQGEFFGNMLDVLIALCDLPENRDLARLLPASVQRQSLANVVKAQPLPGFLLLEDDLEFVDPLLQSIFAHTIDGKIIEDILNNK